MDNQRILLAQQSMALEAARAAGRCQVALAILLARIETSNWEAEIDSVEDRLLGDYLIDESLRLADRLIDRAGKRTEAG